MDLKTTSALSLRHDFPYQARSLGYHIQEAFYRHVLDICDASVAGFYFVVVRTKFPYDTVVYRLTADLLRFAKADLKEALSSIAELERTKKPWPRIAEDKVLDLDWYVRNDD